MTRSNPDQILTVAQMRAAEEALIAGGSSVDALMQIAGRGAGEWVWRIAAGRRVTVLCGPGNNGGDGYVIAELLRERGCPVAVVAVAEPSTDACRNARALYQGEVLSGVAPAGEVLVDCLFGSGLTRPLAAGHLQLLTGLAIGHRQCIAIDLPSGVESDSGRALNDSLRAYDLTLALGAWKFAHLLMPACAAMGALRLVEIGVQAVPGAAEVLARPRFRPPAADAHKYRRGLVAVVAGPMPGAALLASAAAQGSGAGYVKLLDRATAGSVPADLVRDDRPVAEALGDKRVSAVLAGPGLGRDSEAASTLAAVLGFRFPTVLDADALVMLRPEPLEGRAAPLILTPHDGELAQLEQAFALPGGGSKPERAHALAVASRAVVVAKGPDTVIAAPDGRMACAVRASPWLSTAGTGDVLAGAIAGRLATGAEPFAAACEGVWLQAEAARQLNGPFTAGALAQTIPSAYASAL
jgi:ADP-dependent NAD(P)H-hydrate dehydratase / NAD(P)H-hydrate epimerase